MRCWGSHGLRVRKNKNRARTQIARRMLVYLDTGLEWKNRIFS